MEAIPSSHPEVLHQRAYILRIELENFMSHRKFQLDLGPDLNIIVGKNGSGKSAILTALTVGLGGSTAQTNRGSGLSELVKHGTGAAYITITVYNPPNNFKFRMYGSRIVIVKRISAGKGSSLQLKDENLKTLSTKASDLKDISLNLGFFPDNVLAILNQEAAKAFLTSSSQKVKYKNFMDAMRLSSIYSAIENTQAKLVSIEERISSLECDIRRNEERRKVEERWLARTRTAQNSAAQIERNKGLIAWIDVEEAESSLEAAMLGRTNLESQLHLLQNELGVIETQLESDPEDLAHFDQIYNELLQRKEAVNTRLAEYDARAQQESLEVRNTEHKIAEVEQRLQVANEAYNQLGNQMTSEDVERRRIELTSTEFQLQTKRDEVQQEIAQQEQEIIEMSEQLREGEESVAGQEETYRALRDDLEFNTRKLNQLREGTRRYNSASVAERQLGNYDRRLQLSGVLKAIDNEKRWRHKPYGPIGRYVKVKNRKFALTLETILDKTLNTFWVLNKHDEQLLRDILRKLGSSAAIHNRRKDDDFDLSRIQPPSSPRYSRVMDLLHFEDESFARFLVDTDKIEGFVCCQDQATTNELTRNGQRINKLISAFYDRGNGMITRSGGPHNKASEITNVRAVRQRRLTALDEDAAGDAVADAESVRLLEEEDQRLRTEFQVIEGEFHQGTNQLKALKLQYRAKKDSLDSLKAKLAQVELGLSRCASELTELSVFDESASTSRMESIEEEKRTLDRRLRNLGIKFDEQKQKVQGLKGKLHDYKNELRNIETQQKDNETQRRQYQNNRRDAEREKSRIEAQIRHLSSLVDGANAKVASAQTLVASKTELAQELVSNRPETATRDTQAAKLELEEQISALKAALEEAADSIQDIGPRERLLTLLQDSLRKSTDDLKDKNDTKQRLMQDLEERQINNEQAKSEIRAKIQEAYSEVLSKRGYSGSLEFDDVKRTMTVLANPRRNGENRGAAGLSGGEKSFAQLGLLLAIWRCMSVSVVAMDEYDVFMDKINRQLSLQSLIDTILSSNLQGIFITPQDLEVGVLERHQANIRVHKLGDPTR